MLSRTKVERTDELEARAMVGDEDYVIVKTPSRRMAEAATDAWAFTQFGSTAVVRDRRHITALGHLQFHRLRLNVPRLTEQHWTGKNVSRGKGGRTARSNDHEPPPSAPMLHRSMYLTGTSRFDNEDVEFLGDPTDRTKGFIGDGRAFLPPVSFQLTRRRPPTLKPDPLSMVLSAGKRWLQQHGDGADAEDSTSTSTSTPSSSDEEDAMPPQRRRQRPKLHAAADEAMATSSPSSASAQGEDATSNGVRGSAWVGRADAEEIIEKQREWYAEVFGGKNEDAGRQPKAVDENG